MSPVQQYHFDGASGMWVGRGLPDIAPATPPPSGVTKPTRENTGLVGAGSPTLTPWSGSLYVSGSGLEIVNRDFGVSGDVTIAGSNVTLTGCRGRRLIMRGGVNKKVFYSDFEQFVFDGVDGGEMADCFRTQPTIGDDAMQIKSDSGIRCKNITVRHNDLSRLMLIAGAHYDVIQTAGVDNLLVEYNNLEMVASSFSSSYNASFFHENRNGTSDGLILRHNWSRVGGYYHFRLYGTNMTVEDNIFDPAFGGGALIGDSFPLTASSNNRWQDGTLAIPDIP